MDKIIYAASFVFYIFAMFNVLQNESKGTQVDKKYHAGTL